MDFSTNLSAAVKTKSKNIFYLAFFVVYSWQQIPNHEPAEEGQIWQMPISNAVIFMVMVGKGAIHLQKQPVALLQDKEALHTVLVSDHILHTLRY